MSTIHRSHHRRSEKGMVSIMTTMILMVVISLIVLGFAQISRRNQRESLDRQLSTQAFYAAETGVNDVRQLIQTAVANNVDVPDKSSCTDTGVGAFYGPLNSDIDAAKKVGYSCLLVDPSPKVLRFSEVGTPSVVIPMNSATGSAFNTIKLTWQPKVTGSPLTGCPTTLNNVFSAAGSWSCGYGVLRFDLVPTDGSLSADTLQDNTMTTFAVPFSSGGSTSIPYRAGNANTNNTTGVKCTATNCSLSISGLSGASYYMRVSSLYRDVSMQVEATDASSNAIEIKGSQVTIDSTGKAQDVLRRIQVNVPVRNTSQNLLSDYAIESNDAICKRFSVMNGFFSNSASTSSSNILCQ